MTDASSSSRVVVVILTLNQRDKTIRCLSTLFSTQEPPIRVVLWDNGSQDGTTDAVERLFPEVFTRYHRVNLGVAAGRNAAAEVAIRQFSTTHLLFLDNDILVEPGFIRALREPFYHDHRLGQAQAKLRFMHDRQKINDAGGAKINFVLWRIRPVGYGEVDRGQYDAPRSCIACGGATMVRADVFLRLGGFDPLFGPFGPEDLDFSLRLQKSGYRALFVPGAVGYHEVSHTFGKGYSEEYARHKSRHWMRFMHLHATPAQKIGFYLFGAQYLVVRVFLREVRKGNWKAVRGLLRGVLNN